ncbi:hypothetical protein D3C71_1798130 [compost metagenome]
MKSFVSFVPNVEHFRARGDVHDFGQSMGVGQYLGLPCIITPLDGKAYDHGFKIGTRIVDILHLPDRHRGNSIAFLTNGHNQMLGHQQR